MAEFDPEAFEDKYANYFSELQRAYKNAFERMSETHDSDIVHAVDQQVLNESEPFYDDGAFRVELPDDPADRVTAIAVDDDRLAEVLDDYVATIEDELYAVFGVERPE
ncbi:MAG: DUF5783 family protein [Haloferacaceae archaeon]